MISFLLCLAALIVGYFVYGRFVSRILAPDPARRTPCFTREDGVDYIPMPTWKVYMIQFLNIAGVGPIFGAIMGAQFGTASYLWIVLGTILAGATHDYAAAMLSLRHDGESLPETIGRYLGPGMRRVTGVFTVVLLILVGAVFVSSPATLLAALTPGWMDVTVWLVLIFAYYVLATLLPVDKVIGKFYPLFAFCLLFMAVGLMGYLFAVRPELPELWDAPALGIKYNTDPIFPVMFVSIACGAISGFHATQSPLMARCLQNERMARPCFYGAMVTEGIVALVWAAAATYFYGAHGGTVDAEGATFTPGAIATQISRQWLGIVGGLLAIVGIAVAPITSGDTALRSARLIVADFLRIGQKTVRARLAISLPLFAVTAGILVWSLSDPKGFQTLWRYFAWSNQTLSVFTLWAITVCLMRHGRLFWVTYLPAAFMTMVCSAYILVADEGLGLSYALGLILSAVVTLAVAGGFLGWHLRSKRKP